MGEVDMTETKRYLMRITRLNRQIENKLEEASQLRSMASHISAQIQEAKVQESKDPDKIGAAVAKIVDLEREVDDLVDEFIKQRAIIIGQIDGLDDVTYYHVLSKKYVTGKTFETIAAEMNYNMRQVFRVHNRALKAFEDRYGSQYLENTP